jgi:hypothetical protein
MYCEWPMTNMIFNRVPTIEPTRENEELGKTFHECKDGDFGDDCMGGESPDEACNAGCEVLEEGSRSERPNSSNII